MRSNVAIAVLAAGAVWTGFAGAANAQGTATVNPLLPTTGTREISLSGNLQFKPDDAYDIQVGYGPFLNRNIQVGGQLGFARTDVATTGTYEVFGNYHFPSASAALPFVGITLGGATQDPKNGSTDSSFAYGLQGGVKYFLNPNVSISPRLEYTRFSKSGLDDDFRLNLGIGVYLR